MFVYGITPAVGTTLTCSGTPNTEVDQLMVFAAAGTPARSTSILRILVHGRGGALTSISGITWRLKRWTTGSTSGTPITPIAFDPGAQAAKCTAAAVPTAGSVDGAVRLSFGCGAAGPGGWVAENPDAMPVLEAGSGDSYDLYNASATASLTADASMAVVE